MHNNRPKLACLLMLCFSLLSFQAQAAQTNKKEADHLRSIFTKMLDDQKKLVNAGDAGTLEMQGELTVEEAGSYYAITFPHIQIRYPEGTRFELGIISMNAIPHDKDGQWKITYALPTPMRFFTGNNETAKLSIEGQQAGGIFHEDVQQFSKLDAHYKNIAFVNANKPEAKITVSDVVARFDFKEDNQSLWSGPAYVELKDFQVEKGRVKIDSLKASMSMDQYDPKAGLEHKDVMIGLYDSGALKEEPMSAQTQKTITDSLIKSLTSGMNGFKGSYSLSGLSGNVGDDDKETLKIDQALFALSTSGFLSGNVSVGTNFKYEGLDLSSIPAEDKDVLPSKTNLDIQINNIPFKQISAIAKNIPTNDTGNTAQTMQMAGMMLMMKLPALLAQAGTTIELRDNYIGNKTYNLDLNGHVKADMAAVTSATAQINAMFKGLGTLISKVENTLTKTDLENADKFKKLLGNLQMLKAIGKPSANNNDYSYEFIMNEKGEMLLNGQDARTVMSGAKQQQMQQQTP